MADRLYIEKKYLDEIYNANTEKIDFLRLKSAGERADYFMLAMALGLEKGIRTPLGAKEGFILEQSAKNKDLFFSFIKSVALQELLLEGREKEISNTDTVFKIAEEYANTGFAVIQELIPDLSQYKEEDFVFKMMDMLDKKVEILNDN